ncbi:uncharacterized protein RCC_00876 [Ramularia collo-cygni]|uniref:Uncharacterized protein n=1 Tax=Ramularia collo-cygni TaxID=112498 RepID=A0A2D3URC5_9PEZI|nr:uncharacterized protein RCC_00876 [Ramularia collo-cygni]CZT14950.1 uncharacterized protein RCC_00876 [Ramularia collo-cygni]
MRFATSMASVALLSPLVQEALAVNTWEIAFWQGIQCTGEGTGDRTGPPRPRSGSVCGNVPDVGFTTTGNFLIGQGQGYSYYLQLFSDDNCRGSNLGQYDGNPGGNICFETNAARSYKIVTKRGVKRSEEVEIPPQSSKVTDLEVFPIEGRGITSALDTVEKRARYTLGLIQFGVSSTGAWIYMAAGKCPATAKEEDVNKTQCGLAATFAVLSAFFSIYQAQGLYRHGAPAERRIKGRSLASIDEILGLPKMNTTVLPGMSISMHTMEPHYDGVGEAWHQYGWGGVDENTGDAFHAVIRLHPDGRSQAMSEAPQENSGLGKRDSPNAYYSWTGNNKSNFNSADHSKSVVKGTAASVWNYGKSHNVAEHCVDFTDYGQKPTRYIDYGSFALVNGEYVDQSGTCRQ